MMISLLAFIFVFGVLVFIHELGHFGLAKFHGVRVEKFSFGFGPKLLAKKIGTTEYLISAIPLGGYITMSGEDPDQHSPGAAWEFLSKSCIQRAQIIAAGPILNYVLSFLLFSFIFMVGSPAATTRVGKLLDGYPAKQAGVQVGDLILAVDGEPVEYWADMAKMIHQKTMQAVRVDIKRGEQNLQIIVNPKIEESKDIFGQKKIIALVGIYPSPEVVKIKYSLGKSFYKGAEKLFNLTTLTLKGLWFIFIRRLSIQESFTGPIGIFYFTGKAAQLGWVYLLNLMALLSMSLAIFNCLPIPVLDGGHLFFLLLEKLRKRPTSVKTQELATQVGMLFLISLMLFIFYVDLGKFGFLDKASQWWNNTFAP